MRLGGVTVQVTPNGNLGGRGFGELGGMAPPRPIPPLISRPPPKHFTSPSLSLAPPSGVDRQRDGGQSTESEHQFQQLQQQQQNKEEELGSRSGSDNMEGGSDDDQDGEQPPRKKRYHRHTPRQIQEMEMMFKECPHPDDKQRQQLSKELGLAPRQVKFWFQNRRTQMKAQTERVENSVLRAENEKVRAENVIMREALRKAQCPQCGGGATAGEMSLDEQQVRVENVRLKEELDRVSALAAKYLGRPIAGTGHVGVGGSGMEVQVGGGLHASADVVQGGASGAEAATRAGGLTEAERPRVVELAVAAMEELVRMAQAGEPLWVRAGAGGREELNYEEYVRTGMGMGMGLGTKAAGMRMESSRETALVMMNGVNLVEMLMDASQWSEMFPCMVSRAATVEVLSTGVAGNRSGAAQVMYAELQVLSPLVPTREVYFVRYCKQVAEGVWGVVDVSVESVGGKAAAWWTSASGMRCRRRPSGVVIEETPNGYARVTCVEHAEYEERAVHGMYRELVGSGMAFGAGRWVATLERQCERVASLLASNMAARELGGVPSASGRRSMLKLAQRMSMNFCAGVSASTAHTWTTLSGSGDDDVRVMTRKSVDNPGEPQGIVLSAATSMWVGASPARVFAYLRDERVRSEWDILSNGGMVTEMAHIAKGRDPGNSVSLLKVNAMSASNSNMLILQESCTDASGSLVIYAPVDIPAMNVVLQGGDPAYVALLPSGFAILPDGPHGAEGAEGRGSLVTVAFQILVSSLPSARLSLESVATVNNLISCTVQRIRAALVTEEA